MRCVYRLSGRVTLTSITITITIVSERYRLRLSIILFYTILFTLQTLLYSTTPATNKYPLMIMAVLGEVRGERAQRHSFTLPLSHTSNLYTQPVCPLNSIQFI